VIDTQDWKDGSWPRPSEAYSTGGRHWPAISFTRRSKAVRDGNQRMQEAAGIGPAAWKLLYWWLPLVVDRLRQQSYAKALSFSTAMELFWCGGGLKN
jgi:hypothetical protein